MHKNTLWGTFDNLSFCSEEKKDRDNPLLDFAVKKDKNNPESPVKKNLDFLLKLKRSAQLLLCCAVQTICEQIVTLTASRQQAPLAWETGKENSVVTPLKNGAKQTFLTILSIYVSLP